MAQEVGIPARVTRGEMRIFFLNVLDQVNELYESPMFYNTIIHNCMTGMLPQMQEVRKSKRFDIRLLLDGYADRLAYENGMISNELPFEETRRRHHINPYVENDDDSKDYSRRIRPWLGR